ncbi:hypothetical protein [Leifsonia virtsii]|uniref:Tfp pilus assembly protein PilO n=1 Tax=Leifsonia virtsii TaxID=3035915 RepID=A0ABT8IX17_9MICO|nr:hypothetical protein [Leifsonia virtsii]MDN4597345.1 hypothetical protein [Leifsonia virtsii]
MNTTRLWTIGAIVLAAVILVGGWFLAIQPQLSSASDAVAERASVDATNAANLAKLAQLKKDYGKLSETDKELAALRRSIPTETPDYPSFMKDLAAAAASDSVVVTSITFSDAVADQGAEQGAAKAGGSGDGAANGSSTASPSPTATPTPAPTAGSANGAAAPMAGSLIGTAVSVTVKGSWDQCKAFLASMQSGSRLFLVTSASQLPADDGAAWEGKIGGYIYTLQAKAEASDASK